MMIYPPFRRAIITAPISADVSKSATTISGTTVAASATPELRS